MLERAREVRDFTTVDGYAEFKASAEKVSHYRLQRSSFAALASSALGKREVSWYGNLNGETKLL